MNAGTLKWLKYGRMTPSFTAEDPEALEQEWAEAALRDDPVTVATCWITPSE